MIEDDLTFWPTTWGHLTVSDVVRDPTGVEWEIVAGVEVGVKEWFIRAADGRCGWVNDKDSMPVTAARPVRQYSLSEQARVASLFAEVAQ